MKESEKCLKEVVSCFPLKHLVTITLKNYLAGAAAQ